MRYRDIFWDKYDRFFEVSCPANKKKNALWHSLVKLKKRHPPYIGMDDFRYLLNY